MESYKKQLADYFKNEIVIYILFSPTLYNRLSKRYKKKYGVKFALGTTFNQAVDIMQTASANDIDKYKNELIDIFLEDNLMSDTFLQYLYTIYIDEDNLSFDICESIRDRKHDLEYNGIDLDDI